MSRGGFAGRPVLKQSGCSDGAMARWAEKSGGSAGAAFSGREIGSRKGKSNPSSGPSGLCVEEARDKLVGCRADVAGLAAWDVSGGKKGTTYAAKLH